MFSNTLFQEKMIEPILGSIFLRPIFDMATLILSGIFFQIGKISQGRTQE